MSIYVGLQLKIAYHWEFSAGWALRVGWVLISYSFGSIWHMVTIRLSRGGAKKQPFYHIVATDSRSRRDGRYIERLGYYNPVARGSATEVQLDLERVDYWVSVGAQMSDRVRKVVKDHRKASEVAA